MGRGGGGEEHEEQSEGEPPADRAQLPGDAGRVSLHQPAAGSPYPSTDRKQILFKAAPLHYTTRGSWLLLKDLTVQLVSAEALCEQ